MAQQAKTDDDDDDDAPLRKFAKFSRRHDEHVLALVKARAEGAGGRRVSPGHRKAVQGRGFDRPDGHERRCAGGCAGGRADARPDRAVLLANNDLTPPCNPA